MISLDCSRLLLFSWWFCILLFLTALFYFSVVFSKKISNGARWHRDFFPSNGAWRVWVYKVPTLSVCGSLCQCWQVWVFVRQFTLSGIYIVCIHQGGTWREERGCGHTYHSERSRHHDSGSVYIYLGMHAYKCTVFIEYAPFTLTSPARMYLCQAKTIVCLVRMPLGARGFPAARGCAWCEYVCMCRCVDSDHTECNYVSNLLSTSFMRACDTMQTFRQVFKLTRKCVKTDHEYM